MPSKAISGTAGVGMGSTTRYNYFLGEGVTIPTATRNACALLPFLETHIKYKSIRPLINLGLGAGYCPDIAHVFSLKLETDMRLTGSIFLALQGKLLYSISSFHDDAALVLNPGLGLEF